MTDLLPATVLFGDVVDSRRDAGASAYLRALRDDLDDAYGSGCLAATGFTQGDEIQLLLAPGVDPFRAVVRAGLLAGARGLRWACVAGVVEPGTGPATERNGPAFHAARDLLGRAKVQREGLVAVTGDLDADALLTDLGPLLPALLGDLTARQREVGRLLLVDELRQAEAADRLGVSRATISVIADRGHIRHIGRLATALASIFRDGVARAAVVPGAEPPAGDPDRDGSVA
ncbi:MAG TPA: sigma factor-like helix-turn-helix DNA-binding protein [Candidatus Limnocylindrales bacterium]|nr:sigma factor-like helix-turn-helix DNA-binding protein [Candidatus Limnocylindrales bacterium]